MYPTVLSAKIGKLVQIAVVLTTTTIVCIQRSSDLHSIMNFDPNETLSYIVLLFSL